MSLRGLFVKNYRDGKHFNTELSSLPTQNWERCLDRIQKMPREELERHQVFKGHMPFGLHEFLPRPVGYITFLRDPVRRAISHYRMLCRKKIVPPPHVIAPFRGNWNTASHPELAYALDNGQTRVLSGTDPDLPFGACSESHLQKALENLERHFQFVGLTEQFDLSLLLLGKECGWKWHFYVPDNVTPGEGPSLSPALVESIRDLNRFDAELYRYAQERFRALADRHGWTLRAEHRLYSVGNHLHQRLHVLRHRLRRRLGIERRPAMLMPLHPAAP